MPLALLAAAKKIWVTKFNIPVQLLKYSNLAPHNTSGIIMPLEHQQVESMLWAQDLEMNLSSSGTIASCH